jgi:hypothetical protein
VNTQPCLKYLVLNGHELLVRSFGVSASPVCTVCVRRERHIIDTPLRGVLLFASFGIASVYFLFPTLSNAPSLPLVPPCPINTCPGAAHDWTPAARLADTDGPSLVLQDGWSLLSRIGPGSFPMAEDVSAFPPLPVFVGRGRHRQAPKGTGWVGSS